jgi:hypothetical protein
MSSYPILILSEFFVPAHEVRTARLCHVKRACRGLLDDPTLIICADDGDDDRA